MVTSATSSSLASALGMSGLISGLSTSDIIAKLMAVDQQSLTSLQDKVDTTKQRADAINDIRTRLSSLLTTIQNLNLRATIDSKTVTADTPSSSPTLVTATAGSEAALGSFDIRVMSLATSTSLVSSGLSGAAAIGKAVQANQQLASAGFGITPTTGTFTVNGAKVTIDADTVLSDGVDAVGANTVFAKVRDATAGLAADKQVTVSWGLDANGRQNKLVLSATGNIQLGGGSDTSNFLNAAGLDAIPSASTMTSARNLGAVNTGAYLNTTDPNLDVALTSSTGSFKINGVEITYDGAVDSLSTVISRINSSAAGVTASYDSIKDQITLTSKTTGAKQIDLEDVTGNFLAAMKLSTGNETLGASAHYKLNDEDRYSTSNTVTDAVTGVTINLVKADPDTDVTMTVNQNTTGTVNAVKSFISQYNSAMSLIRDKTSYDDTNKKAGLLLGDSAVLSIETSLSSVLSGMGTGLSSVAQSLSAIGITTGAVGSAVGTTTQLVLDESKLTSVLRNNPTAVADVFGALTSRTTLESGGTGSIASVAGTPTNHVSGSYSIISDDQGNLTATFTSAGGSTKTYTGKIEAGGTNSTLIPGLVINAKPILSAGTDTVTSSFTAVGVGVKLADFLTSLTSASGALASAHDSADAEVDYLNKSITDTQTRLDAKQQQLQTKFNALEVALAKLQSQSDSLSAQLAKLS
jgi:flagellar hook-associated protein 2